MRLYLKMRPLKRWLNENEAFGVGSNPIWLVSSKRRQFGPTERHQGGMSTEWKSHEDTEQAVHPQARDKGLRRDQPCWHLDLGPLASKHWRLSQYSFVSFLRASCSLWKSVSAGRAWGGKEPVPSFGPLGSNSGVDLGISRDFKHQPRHSQLESWELPLFTWFSTWEMCSPQMYPKKTFCH